MKWNKKCNLDERQLMIRGNIFKHGWALSLSLLVINTVLQDIFGHRIFIGLWDSLFILALTVSVATIEMIYYEIYPLTKQVHKRLYILLGIMGFVFIGFGLYYILMEQEPILVAGMVNIAPSMICVGACYLSVYIAYLIVEKLRQEEE